MSCGSSGSSREASFNVNGQRSAFNNFLLDGLDNNNYGTSNQGFANENIPPSPDAVSEFKVETNNYSAEYGRASGAVINVATRRGTIKPVLLDQRVVAGLGNIYAAEALWHARISPAAPAASLPQKRIAALLRAIRKVIARATGARYTDDDVSKLAVYDREGLPCRRCGTPIERVVQAGRSTYFCPTCQAD